MNKIGWLIALIVFVFVTVFVLSLDDNTVGRRVKISNQNFEITHENTELVNNETVKINLNDSKINNAQINTNNSNIALNSANLNIDNSGNINNSSMNFENSSGFSNQSNSFENSDTNYSNQGINTSNANNLKFNNLDDSHLDTMLNNAKNVSTQPRGKDNRPLRQMPQRDRYVYKDIDWNTWQSNFVNKILDDSMSIRELDQYNAGTWLYYQFDVYKDGRIDNISVRSMVISQHDKDLVANLIKNYAYKDITIFPANTKREKAQVKAVMMLSNTTQKSTPNDFNENERIKIHIGR